MARHRTFPAATVAVATLLAGLSSPAAAQTAGVDFDAVGMFAGAVPVVKGVMILLILASMASWALFFVKVRDISAGVRSVNATSERIRAADRLVDVTAADHATAAMIAAAGREIEKSALLVREGRTDGMRDRIEDVLVRIEHGMVARMREGLPVLASVGSVAPFVGLFGTVWGIMHSFVGIAAAKSTSLAVVAPGIAEALLATALGLVAAIPATIMYNLLGRRMAVYRQSLGDSATLLTGLIGREIELATLSGQSAGTRLQQRVG